MTGSTIIAELLRAGHAVRFPAHGFSMAPTIHSGDFLLVEPAHPSEVRPGDVVLSLTPRGLTAHRVINIDASDVFTTRGDNAAASDEPFGANALLGRVVRLERAGGRVAISPPPARRFVGLLAFLGLRPLAIESSLP
jgi:signal peptidase I